MQHMKTLIFRVEKRKNIYTKKRFEWALHCKFIDEMYGSGWIVYVWKHRPSENEIKTIAETVLRGMEVYHASMSIPAFKISYDIDMKVEE